ncbi:RHS repeat-associated core domain-containing protein, partial [Microbulbifer epialgicus]
MNAVKVSKLGIVIVTLYMLFSSISSSAEDIIGNISGDVSVSNGSLSYSLALPTPSSIHNLNPNLTLNYHQQSGPGTLGMGFSLSSSSSISRCTPNEQKDSFSAGIERNANSRFCHDGKKLVAISGGNGAAGTEYRKYQDDNTKYISGGGSNNTPIYWEQYSPDGYILRYERVGLATDLFANWLLVKKEDQFGNAITYQYSETSVPLLMRIIYPGYSVEFVYEDRLNALSQYQQGVQATLDKRLQKIQVIAGSQDSFEYRFNYESTNVGIAAERLQSLTRCYGNAGSDGCLKPVLFDYLPQPTSGQALDATADKTIVIPKSYYKAQGDLPEVGFAYRPSFAAADLNRDGYTDFCYYKPEKGLMCTLHNGTGYGSLIPWSEDLGFAASADDYSYYANLYMVDLNSDGYSDYCIANKGGMRCGLNSGGNHFNPASYWSTKSSGGIGSEEFPSFQYVDGDNNIDICGVIGESYRCFKNTGSSFSGQLVGLDGPLNIRHALTTDEGINFPKPDWKDIDGDLDLDICWLTLLGDFKCAYRSVNPSTHAVQYSTPQVVANLNVPQAPLGDWADSQFREAMHQFSLTLRYGDLNGDGLVDICYGNGQFYQCQINTGAGLTQARQWLDISHLFTFEDREDATLASITLSDMNLDGLADFCVIYGGYQYCAYNEVNQFSVLTPRQIINADIDVDTSVVKAYANFVRRWFGSTTEYRSSAVRAAFGKFLPVTDVNNDGYTDTCYRSIDGVVCVTNDNFAPHALLTGVTDSFGRRTDIEYKNLLGTGLYKPAASIPDGFYENPQNRKVVSMITTDSGAYDRNSNTAIRNAINYQYEGFLVNRTEDIRGFAAVEWHDSERNSTTRSQFYLQRHLEGREQVIEETVNNVLLKRKTNHYGILTQSNGTVRVVLDSSSEEQNDLSGDIVSITEATNSDFDTYGFPQTITLTKQQDYETLTTVTSTSYVNNTSLWLLGRPDMQTVTHSDSSGNRIVREVDYQYNHNGLLSKQINEASSALSLTIEYEYDSSGNAEKVTSSGSGESRSLTKTFDALGRVKTQTNSANQTELFSYHDRCGGVETHTDIAGRLIRTHYDDMCRSIKEESYDSNEITREFFWADSADNYWINEAPNYPLSYKNPIVYKVKESTAAGPWTISYYDAQGRAVKVERLGYSDTENQRVSMVFTAYDRYGRKTATTLPYFKTNGQAITPSWITIGYDAVGRVQQETKVGPYGTPVTSTYSYHRGTTTQRYVDYQKVTDMGIHGKAKRITENGLSIDYSYDPMGNLLTTTTGGLTTTLEYDDVGNKSKQIDPSMGTWEYRYNAFGELVWQRDAKAQVTTFEYNSLGQQVKRSDPDGITTWHYFSTGNGIGQLQREESPAATKEWQYNTMGLAVSETLTVEDQSFATLYAYDHFSRLITKTESNGLEVHYEYDQTGAVDSVSIPQEDFKDFNYSVLEREYEALLKLYVETESKIAQLERQAEYHHKRAIEFAAKVQYFAGLLKETNRQIQDLEKTATQHQEMAERYLEQARVEREKAAQLRAQFGDKTFEYTGESGNYYNFRYKRCTKKKRSWGGLGPKKCKRYETHNISVFAGERNPVDVNAGMTDRSVKYYEESRTIDYRAFWEKLGVDTTGMDTEFTYTYKPRHVKPYQIYENAAASWEALADVELKAAHATREQIDQVDTVKIMMPVEVTRETWVPISGEITFFLKMPVTFMENQLVDMTLQQAANYYQSKIDQYKALAKQELNAYQKIIDGEGSIEGLEALRNDLFEYRQSKNHFENSLLSMGIDVEDLALATGVQETLTAVNGRLNIWMATMRRPDGALERELFGNGLRTVRHFNDQNGLIERISTSSYSGTVLRDIEYTYNDRGLVTAKQDLLTDKHQTEENFIYDVQGRLTDWSYSQAVNVANTIQQQSLNRSYRYDERGNLTFKTGAGDMLFNASTNRLVSRTLDNQTFSYGYDSNGNMLTGDGRTYQWTAFNKVRQVTANGIRVNYGYDGSHKRVIKDSDAETIYYVSPSYEVVHQKAANGATQEIIHRHHVWNGNDVVATYEKRQKETTDVVEQALQTDQVAYYHRDIIGSGEVVTGSDMEVLERRFYTPYGELIQHLLPQEAPDTELVVDEREVEIADDVDYKQLINSIINKPSDFSLLSENMLSNVGFAGDLRGYTSHETVKEVDLVNMNARMYDPVIGRFISADSLVPDITRPLSYNRYSYVEGNPILGRDPSGHWVWLTAAFVAFVAAHDTDSEALQILSTIALAAAGGFALGAEGYGVFEAGFWGAAGTAATVSVSITYLKKGSLNSEDLRNAAWSALAAGAASFVGGQFENYTGDYEWAFKAAAHGAVQGGISLLRGDGFRQGAISGLASSLGGSAIKKLGLNETGIGNATMRTLVVSGFGFLASEATGGDGVRGAMTAAAVHLFNHEAHLEASANAQKAQGPSFAGFLREEGVNIL